LALLRRIDAKVDNLRGDVSGIREAMATNETLEAGRASFRLIPILALSAAFP
jgi:hypothetical protein